MAHHLHYTDLTVERERERERRRRGRKRLIESKGGRKGQVKEGGEGWTEVRNEESEGQKINYS